MYPISSSLKEEVEKSNTSTSAQTIHLPTSSHLPEIMPPSTRSDAAAYEAVSQLLDNIWDKSISKFPSFIIVIHLCSSKGKWNAAGTSNILTIDGENILTEYNSIMDALITTALVAQIDKCTIQNSSAFFKCLEISVTENLKEIIFT